MTYEDQSPVRVYGNRGLLFSGGPLDVRYRPDANETIRFGQGGKAFVYLTSAGLANLLDGVTTHAPAAYLAGLRPIAATLLDEALNAERQIGTRSLRDIEADREHYAARVRDVVYPKDTDNEKDSNHLVDRLAQVAGLSTGGVSEYELERLSSEKLEYEPREVMFIPADGSEPFSGRVWAPIEPPKPPTPAQLIQSTIDQQLAYIEYLRSELRAAQAAENPDWRET